MLVGFVETNEDKSAKKPIYVSDNGPLLVGQGIFDLLLAKGLPVIDVESLDDIEANGGSEPFLVRVKTLSNVAQTKGASSILDGRVFILCEGIGFYESQSLLFLNERLENGQESFDRLVLDLTGVKQDTKQTQKNQATQKEVTEPRRIKEEPLVPELVQPEAKRTIDWTIFKRRLKKDGLNLLFAIVFVLLSFATELGYFFLGHDSSQAFRIACIVMAGVFPFMACIPMGFLYQDRGCTKPSDSLVFMASLVVVALVAFLCPMICLGLGSSLVWNQADLILFTCLGLSAIVWILLRLLLAGPIRKAFAARSVH